MKEQYITALMIAPGLKPTVITLENSLDTLQKAVSLNLPNQCLIEVISLAPDACLICNEEGKFLALPGNRRLGRDIIAGVFYIVGTDDEGNFTSLSHDAALKYVSIFKTPESISDDEVADAIFIDFAPIP